MANQVGTKELVSLVAQEAGVTQKDTRAVLDALGAILADSLAEHTNVVLPKVGVFRPRVLAEREYNNFHTGEPVVTKPMDSVSFKAYKSFREVVKSIQDQ